MSLKKKEQLLGFWSSLSHKPAEENTTQGQGQDELSTADGMERCIYNAVYVEESSGTSTGNGSTSSENPALNPASSSTSANIVKPGKRARVQEELQEKIAVLQNDLVGLYHRKSKDMLSSEQSVELKQKQKQVTDLNKNLHGKELDAKRQRKKRLKFKQQLQKVVEMVPEAAAIIGSHNDKTPGRPRLEAQ